MQLRKIILLVLVLVVVALGSMGAIAHGNMCDGQIDQQCHRDHNPDGSEKLYCELYVNVGTPLCWDGGIGPY